jgi:hypothetical protein
MSKRHDYFQGKPTPPKPTVAQHKVVTTPLPAGAPKPGFLGSKTQPTPGTTPNHPGTKQAVPPKNADGSLGYGQQQQEKG